MIRGGSWNYTPESLRASYRDWFHADNRYFIIGFRLAQDMVP